MAPAGVGGSGAVLPGDVGGNGGGDSGDGTRSTACDPSKPGQAARRERASRASQRGRLHFWVIQVTELAVAVAFVDISLHVTRAAVLLGAAGVLTAMSLTAKGPLGVVRLVGRPTHRVLALAVAAGMALAPVVPALRPGVDGIAILEIGAAGLARVATLIRVAPGSPAGANDGRVAGHIGRTDDDGTPPSSASGVRAGPTPAARVARWAGRATSQAGTTVNRAADKHGPIARAQVLRAARASGRVAAKIEAARRRSARDTRDTRH